MCISYNELKVQKLVSSFKFHFDRTYLKNAIIGLSGGVDSALAVAIVSKAIGADNVFSYYLPFETSSKLSFSDAKTIAEKFKINFEVIDITKVCSVFFEQNCCDGSLRKGNAMARVRMLTLFDIAQRQNGIVIGTSNFTERLLGYGTLFGDTASAINPIGMLYKREVFELSKYLGVPDCVVNKAPTGDLWEGQTDEDELGFTYDIADKVLYSVIELGLTYSEVKSIFGDDLVDIILKRVIKNRFKSKVPIICEYEIRKYDIDNIFNNLGVV